MQFGCDAARAQHHDRANQRIVAIAEHQFQQPVFHPLHQDAVDLRIGCGLARVGQQPRGGGGQFSVIAHAHLYAADLGLVQDVA